MHCMHAVNTFIPNTETQGGSVESDDPDVAVCKEDRPIQIGKLFIGRPFQGPSTLANRRP